MDSRDLEQLIQAAAASESNADYEKLFASLPAVELYLNFNNLPPPGSSQAEIVAAPISTPLVNVGNGLQALVVFSSKDNSKLKRPFGGLPWKQVLEMLVEMPEADGLVIEGADLHWVAIDKARARLLLQSM